MVAEESQKELVLPIGLNSTLKGSGKKKKKNSNFKHILGNISTPMVKTLKATLGSFRYFMVAGRQCSEKTKQDQGEDTATVVTRKGSIPFKKARKIWRVGPTRTTPALPAPSANELFPTHFSLSRFTESFPGPDKSFQNLKFQLKLPLPNGMKNEPIS